MTEIKPGDKLRIIDDVTGHGFKDGAIVTVVGGDIDEDSPLATTLAWEDGDDIPAWDHGVTAYVIIGEEAEVIRPDRPLTLPEPQPMRSEEHTSELQSRENLVCRLLLEKKKKK